MEVYALHPKEKPIKLGSPDHLPETGYLWVDLEREEKVDWLAIPERLLGVKVLDQHRSDSLTTNHPSFFDSTASYDQIIFKGLSPHGGTDLLDTRTCAFYLFDRLLISIHEADAVAVQRVKEKLLHPGFPSPESAFGLLHMLVDTLVNRFLAIRNPLAEELEKLQDALLDSDSPYSDWKSLLTWRKQIRRLESLSSSQYEAISTWQSESRMKLSESQSARMTDLLEHVDRIQHHAQSLQNDIESALQLHFSAVSHRTNEIMRVLTILSAIFLPLNLVAGIFGMNFEFMPFLKVHYGYYFTLAGMAVLAVLLMIVLRIRHWL